MLKGRVLHGTLAASVIVMLTGCLSVSKSPESKSVETTAPNVSEAPVWLESAPQSYTVQADDSVWDVSKQFLKTPWDWKKVTIDEARFPVDRYAPPMEGAYLPSVYTEGVSEMPASNTLPVISTGLVYVFPGDTVTQVATEQGKKLKITRAAVVKWSPHMRRFGSSGAIPTVPWTNVSAFVKTVRLMPEKQVRSMPHIVPGARSRLLSMAGDRLFATSEEPLISSTYNVFRMTRELGEGDILLGQPLVELQKVGEVDVVRQGDPAELVVLESKDAIRAGDVLESYTQEPSPYFDLEAAPMGMRGRLSSYYNRERVLGSAFDTAMIDLGEKDGVKVGHTFQVLQHDEKIIDDFLNKKRWVNLPGAHSGWAVVVKSYPDVSYVILLETPLESLKSSIVRSPKG